MTVSLSSHVQSRGPLLLRNGDFDHTFRAWDQVFEYLVPVIYLLLQLVFKHNAAIVHKKC